MRPTWTSTDSAGGSAKQGRNKNYQAILPLKGKVLNIEKAEDITKISNNNEIRSIIQALGCGYKDSFDIRNLRYHKIIIMTDADPDGSHITSLLITFLWKLLPELIANGHVYLANPPLYELQVNNKISYIRSDKEKEAITHKLQSQNKSYMIQRFKGLGEMNADQLRSTTMDINSRTLTQITIKSAKKAEEMIITMMGKDSAMRKKFIDKYLSKIKSIEDIL